MNPDGDNKNYLKEKRKPLLEKVCWYYHMQASFWLKMLVMSSLKSIFTYAQIDGWASQNKSALHEWNAF